VNECIQLQPSDESYTYIFTCVQQPHVQSAIHGDWVGLAGFHRLCTLLDDGGVFLVPVIDGSACGLAFAEEVDGGYALEGHLAFFRKIPPATLQQAMAMAEQKCSELGYKELQVDPNGLSRAARAFIKRCGFDHTSTNYRKELSHATCRRKS